jgi:hypothetical protein
MQNGENRVFGRSDGGQNNLNKAFLCITSEIWTTATY